MTPEELTRMVTDMATELADMYPALNDLLSAPEHLKPLLRRSVLTLLAECNRDDIPRDKWPIFYAYINAKALADDARHRALTAEVDVTLPARAKSTAIKSTKVEFGATPAEEAEAKKYQIAEKLDAQAADIWRKLVHSLRRFPRPRFDEDVMTLG